MSGYTSVRLSRFTRDKLNELADEYGMTADRTIEFLIDEFLHERWTKEAIAEMDEIMKDPAEQAELRAVMQFMGTSVDDDPEPSA